MSLGLSIGGLCVVVWLYLLLGRGRFWLGWTEPAAPPLADYPPVLAVIPARDEAAVIGRTLLSLFGQTYPGALRVVVVDDHSADGTAAVARTAAAEANAADRLSIVPAAPLPAGWAGKVWAMAQGLQAAAEVPGAASGPGYVLFTDADIAWEAGALRALVRAAEEDDREIGRASCRERVLYTV